MSANSVALNELSPFGRAALALDQDFSELSRLGAEIESVNIETEKGLERSKQLLVKFADCGTRVAAHVMELSRFLETSRSEAEETARSVSAKALEIQARHELSEAMMGRFRSLGENVRAAMGRIPDLKSESKEANGANALIEKVPAIESELDALIEQAAQLRSDARAQNMRELDRNADSLTQSLQSARRKLQSLTIRP